MNHFEKWLNISLITNSVIAPDTLSRYVEARDLSIEVFGIHAYIKVIIAVEGHDGATERAIVHFLDIQIK